MKIDIAESIKRLKQVVKMAKKKNLNINKINKITTAGRVSCR